MTVAIGRTANYYCDSTEKLLNQLNILQEKGSYVYRGYSRQEEIFPNLMRAEQYVLKERSFLHDFEYYGKSYINATSPIEFMSYGQHYGLKTRLLDFTYNPYVALCFALHSGKTGIRGEDKECYYLLCCNIDDNIVVKDVDLLKDINGKCIDRRNSLALQSMQLIDYIESVYSSPQILNSGNLINFLGMKYYETGLTIKELKDKIENKKMLFIDHNLNNQRIIMQQGLFMFPYTLDRAEYEDMIYRNSIMITIPRKIRKEVLRILDGLGFNIYKLMPDLASICSEITVRAEKDENKLLQKK